MSTESWDDHGVYGDGGEIGGDNGGFGGEGGVGGLGGGGDGTLEIVNESFTWFGKLTVCTGASSSD